MLFLRAYLAQLLYQFIFPKQFIELHGGPLGGGDTEGLDLFGEVVGGHFVCVIDYRVYHILM